MEERQKPVVFISHASTDGVFANAVKHEIEKVLAHVYQAYFQSIDILGSYDDSKAQVALQMRTEAGYGGDQTMVLRVPPGAGWMSNAS